MGGTQGYQPCADAGNNPITWTDPSGLSPTSGRLAGLGHAIARVFFHLTWAIARPVGPNDGVLDEVSITR